MGLISDSFIPDTWLLDFSMWFQWKSLDLNLRSPSARFQVQRTCWCTGSNNRVSPTPPAFLWDKSQWDHRNHPSQSVLPSLFSQSRCHIQPLKSQKLKQNMWWNMGMSLGHVCRKRRDIGSFLQPARRSSSASLNTVPARERHWLPTLLLWLWESQGWALHQPSLRTPGQTRPCKVLKREMRKHAPSSNLLVHTRPKKRWLFLLLMFYWVNYWHNLLFLSFAVTPLEKGGCWEPRKNPILSLSLPSPPTTLLATFLPMLYYFNNLAVGLIPSNLYTFEMWCSGCGRWGGGESVTWSIKLHREDPSSFRLKKRGGGYRIMKLSDGSPVGQRKPAPQGASTATCRNPWGQEWCWLWVFTRWVPMKCCDSWAGEGVASTFSSTHAHLPPIMHVIVLTGTKCLIPNM